MLKIEDIKKCCEFADGFKWEEENNMFQFPNGKRFYFAIKYEIEFINDWDILYPLFLQRVIDGMIKKYGFEFDLYYKVKAKKWVLMFYNKPSIVFPESRNIIPEKNNVTPDYETPDEC